MSCLVLVVVLSSLRFLLRIPYPIRYSSLLARLHATYLVVFKRVKWDVYSFVDGSWSISHSTALYVYCHYPVDM